MGDDDAQGRLHARAFKFKKVNKQKQRRKFVVQTPKGPFDLCLEIYLHEGFIWGKVICEQDEIMTRILTRLSYKFDDNIDEIEKWLRSYCLDAGIGLNHEIKLTSYQDHQNMIIGCDVFYNLNKTKNLIYKNIKGDCTNGLDHKELLKSAKFADFTIHAGGQQFSCHKVILAAKSPVFERMLTTDMKESKENQVILTDVTPETVNDMLNYIYTNNVIDLAKKAKDLLPVADVYDLAGLKKECSAALIKQINKESAVELALMADTYNTEDLRIAAVCFMVDNKMHFQKDPSWRETFINNPSLLMEMFQMCKS